MDYIFKWTVPMRQAEPKQKGHRLGPREFRCWQALR